MVLCFFHILDSDQTDTIIVSINNNQLFNAVFVQQTAGFIGRCPVFYRDNRARHQICDTLLRIGGKAYITIGQNTHQFVAGPLAINHGNTADMMRFHHLQRIS